MERKEYRSLNQASKHNSFTTKLFNLSLSLTMNGEPKTMAIRAQFLKHHIFLRWTTRLPESTLVQYYILYVIYTVSNFAFTSQFLFLTNEMSK